MNSESEVPLDLEQFGQDFARLQKSLAAVLIGQQENIDLTLSALIGGGHVLIEGPPGVGKTLLGRTLAQLLDAEHRRIQFTSDLMPADVIGTYVVMESQGRRRFEFQQGPIFTNLLLADEINRATPKTQAALFEALEERALTVANETYALPSPFFAIATQSLGDIEGTFPVPETQLDRFFFKLRMEPPAGEGLQTVLRQTTGAAAAKVAAVMNASRIVAMQQVARQVKSSDDVFQYVANLITATQPHSELAPESTRRFVLRGASPRGGQAMILSAKVLAAVAGREHISMADLQRVAAPALRHRLMLNFEGHAEEAGLDGIIGDIMKAVKA